MKKNTFFHEHLIHKCLVSKTKLLYGILLNCICCVFCIQASAQQPVGTVFTSGSFEYVITVAGTASANSNREVAVKDYLDVNNLTPTIPSTTFYGATYNVTSIGFGALANNSLTSVTIPSSVTSIEDGAFENNSLTSVAIPSSVTSIGVSTFGINSLTSITLPSSVTSIGVNAFTNNSTLVEVISQSTNPAILLPNTFDDNSIIDLTVPVGFEQDYIDANWVGFQSINSTNYTITQNDIVYQILDITNNDEVATFDYIGTNTTVAIPASITDSGSNYDVTTIGDFSFASNSLATVTIPSSVITIGASAFNNNSLTSVTIPSFVTTIGEYAFNNNYNLITVTSESTNPATLISYTFFNNNYGIDLFIPAGTTSAYTSAGWINFNITEAACTVTIPDANFKNYLVGNTLINTNGDTEIQCSEASAFTGSIECSNMSISDLTGIEAFTGIWRLICSSNPLTSLDVSANTALTHLFCTTNQLSNLDVSNNLALLRLSCGDNQLTSLDVSNNTDLTILSCQFNQITSLDVSANSALESLDCNVNQLTSIDVSANSALETLGCNNNQLTDVDVSANTALTRFFSNDNQLTSLNVANGNNSNFIYFRAQNNPSLTCITVDDVAYSNANWTYIDSQTSFSTNCAALSVNDFTIQNISIYPNPITSVLNIEMTSTLKQVTIYNILGAKVLNTSTKSINTSNLKSGMYLLKIEDENGQVSTKRFIKQ